MLLSQGVACSGWGTPEHNMKQGDVIPPHGYTDCRGQSELGKGHLLKGKLGKPRVQDQEAQSPGGSGARMLESGTASSAGLFMG